MTLLLVNRPTPYPDESLVSYLERLVQANHYDPPSLFTAWLRTDNRDTRAVNTVRQPAFFQRLIAVTGQPLTTIHRMTAHRYAPLLLPPEVHPEWLPVNEETVLPLFPAKQPKPIRTDDAAVYCPCCLQENAYHRIYWHFSGLTLCPFHARWFIDRCSNCGRPLTVTAITNAHCQHCRCDLRTAESTPLLQHDLAFQAQSCLYAWLDGRPAPGDLHLPIAPAPILFRLLDGLRVAAQNLGIGWAFLHDVQAHEPLPPAHSRRRLSLRQTSCLYATALRGLRDWPDGFFAFLDAYRLHTGGHGLEELGVLYTTWLEHSWQHPAFAFVQEAFNGYLTSHFPPTRAVRQSVRLKRHPELAERFEYIDVRNAARQLNTSPPKIQRLVRDGLLTVYPVDDPVRPGIFLYRDQLKTWQEETFLTKKQAAAILGVSVPMLDKLVEHGLLKMTGKHHKQDKVLAVLLLSDVERFRQQLSVHVNQQAFPTHGALTLKQAAGLNGKVGWGMVNLFERVLTGKLNAFQPHPELEPLSALWFEEQAIRALTQQVKDENGWLGFLETAALLQVGRRVLHHWIDSGLLIPVASFARAQYFLRSNVLKFHQRRVTTPEAVIWLETTRAAVSYWVRAGYLQILSGPGTNNHSEYVFDRQYLQAWHTQYITTPETKRLLNATDHLLRLWREKGKLTQLTREHRRPTFYARDQVFRLQQDLVQHSPA
ncbi:MAG: TniQ family protein [Aggregatilineales bacterium]